MQYRSAHNWRLIRMRLSRSNLFAFACITLVVSLLLTSCGKSSATDNSLSSVQKAGVLKVATDDTYPPLEWNDNGTIKGYDIDLMTEVASRLGVEAEFISTKWDGLLTGLSVNQYDAVISSMNITPGRLEEANFVEYMQWVQVIVMSPDSSPISTLEGLEGKRIAVQVSTTSEEMAKSVKDAQVTSFESFDTTFMELKNGRCDAVIIDEPVGMYYQKLEPSAFVITGTAGEKAPVGIALRKNATALTEAIEKALDEMDEDGTAGRIYDAWFK
jgi:polar amino acid transport system substrate-binding protein